MLEPTEPASPKLTNDREVLAVAAFLHKTKLTVLCKPELKDNEIELSVAVYNEVLGNASSVDQTVKAAVVALHGWSEIDLSMNSNPALANNEVNASMPVFNEVLKIDWKTKNNIDE